MVSKTITVCDLHDDDEVLAVDNVILEDSGEYFELDLCPACLKDWKTFEDLRGQFRQAGRQVERTPMGAAVLPPRRRSSHHLDPVVAAENQAIRKWAKEQNIPLGDRGRIPAALRRKFREIDAPRRWDAAASD